MTTMPTPVPLDKDSQMLYYAWWLQLSAGERTMRGLPRTQDDLATVFGLKGGGRSIRRWESTPAWSSLLATGLKGQNPLRKLPLLTTNVTDLVPVSPSAGYAAEEQDDLETGETGDLDDISDVEGLKVRLLRRAQEGDPRALDGYMKYWGKSEVEAQAAASAIQYDSVTLEALILESLELLSPDIVVAWLANNGWRVEKVES